MEMYPMQNKKPAPDIMRCGQPVDLELVHCITTAGPTGYCGAVQRDEALSKPPKRSPRRRGVQG
jgi:hypothetical protein